MSSKSNGIESIASVHPSAVVARNGAKHYADTHGGLGSGHDLHSTSRSFGGLVRQGMGCKFESVDRQLHKIADGGLSQAGRDGTEEGWSGQGLITDRLIAYSPSA